MDWEDTFTDAMDGTVMLEAIDNADGEFVIITLSGDNGNGDANASWSIALNADQANALALTLRALAEGVE